jgi:heat shock protein HtpX
MNMYKQIARNKRDSWFLMTMVVLILLGLGFAIGVATMHTTTGGIGLLGVFGVVAIVWSLISYYAGAGMALAVSGARAVTHEQEPQLYNVVEEMSVASGMPMPKVYIIEQDAPNAFATGRDPQHSAVAVTRGLLTRLNREELQGVVAHEMSHVRNYDIRFATLVGIMVGMVALIADFFLRFTFFGGMMGGGGRRSSNNDSGGGQLAAIMFVVAIVLAIVAPIFAYLVQFAISRRREYLADASGVELTRNPLGLASALQKIAADPDPLRTANRATAHLYIANPLRNKKAKATAGLLDTHPPIQERIRILREMAYEHDPIPPVGQPAKA